MINDDLERLANRGPSRDPAAVVDDALAAARTSPRFAARPVAASVAVVLVAGLVIGLAMTRDSDGSTTVDSSVFAPVPAPTLNTSTPTAAPQPAATTSCPEIEVSWPDRTDGPTMAAATIRAFYLQGGAAYYQVATGPDVFMTRGPSFDGFELNAEQATETIPVTVKGYDTEVRPPGTGFPGQNVGFVFPATASPTNPCNRWTISANTPMDIDEFLTMLDAIDMQLIENQITTPSTTTTTDTTASTVAVGPLSDLTLDEVAVPTVVPPGWTFQPLIVDGRSEGSGWTFVDDATNRTGTVEVDAFVQSRVTSTSVTRLAGVDWTTEESESLTIHRAHLDNATVIVNATGFNSAEVEQLLDGLRSGALSAYPGGTFNPTSDGEVVATATAGVVRAANVHDHLCWGYVESDELRYVGCTKRGSDAPLSELVQVDSGIDLLASFGSETAAGSDWNDTNIGVADPAISAVKLSYSDGTTVTVPTEDASGALGVRFFIAIHNVERNGESHSLEAVEAVR